MARDNQQKNLFLYFHEEMQDDPVCLAWVRRSATACVETTLSNLTRVFPRVELFQITVIVAGHSVPGKRLRVPIKAASKIEKSVPWMMEEELSVGLDQVHLSHTRRNHPEIDESVFLVLGVEHHYVRAWLDTLARFNVHPQRLVPIHALLPESSTGIGLRLNDVIAYSDHNSCGLFDANSAPGADLLESGVCELALDLEEFLSEIPPPLESAVDGLVTEPGHDQTNQGDQKDWPGDVPEAIAGADAGDTADDVSGNSTGSAPLTREADALETEASADVSDNRTPAEAGEDHQHGLVNETDVQWPADIIRDDTPSAQTGSGDIGGDQGAGATQAESAEDDILSVRAEPTGDDMPGGDAGDSPARAYTGDESHSSGAGAPGPRYTPEDGDIGPGDTSGYASASPDRGEPNSHAQAPAPDRGGQKKPRSSFGRSIFLFWRKKHKQAPDAANTTAAYAQSATTAATAATATGSGEEDSQAASAAGDGDQTQDGAPVGATENANEHPHPPNLEPSVQPGAGESENIAPAAQDVRPEMEAQAARTEAARPGGAGGSSGPPPPDGDEAQAGAAIEAENSSEFTAPGESVSPVQAGELTGDASDDTPHTDIDDEARSAVGFAPAPTTAGPIGGESGAPTGRAESGTGARQTGAKGSHLGGQADDAATAAAAQALTAPHGESENGADIETDASANTEKRAHADIAGEDEAPFPALSATDGFAMMADETDVLYERRLQLCRWIERNIEQNGAINLLTGKYTPKSKLVSEQKLAQFAVWSASLSGIALCAYFIVFGAIFQTKANQLEQQARQRFSTLFPNVREIRDIRRQTAGLLRSIKQGQGIGGGLGFAEIIGSVEIGLESAGVKYEVFRIRFSQADGKFLLSVYTDSITSANVINASLNAQGFETKLLSADSNGTQIAAIFNVNTSYRSQI